MSHILNYFVDFVVVFFVVLLAGFLAFVADVFLVVALVFEAPSATTTLSSFRFSSFLLVDFVVEEFVEEAFVASTIVSSLLPFFSSSKVFSFFLTSAEVVLEAFVAFITGFSSDLSFFDGTSCTSE